MDRYQTQLHGHPCSETKECLVCAEGGEAGVLLPGQLVEEQAGEDGRDDGPGDEEGKGTSVSVDADSRNNCRTRS